MSRRKQSRRRQSRGTAMYAGIGLIIAAIIVAVVVLRQPQNSVSSAASVEFPDIHGMGFSADGNRLIVPAHAGLRVYENNRWSVPTDLPVHDYMGYSATDNGFYSSGHPDLRTDLPPMLGLIKSEDEGRSIETLAFTGESDFHLLSAGYFSHAIYVGNGRPNSGMDTGLYYTTDDGQTWTQSRGQGLNGNIFQIAAHPTEAGTVAIASEAGLFLSNDFGDTFVQVGDVAPISAVSFYPSGEILLYGYRDLFAYNQTTNEVETLNNPALNSDDIFSYLAASPTANQLAIATINKNIFRSDDGQSWQQIAISGVGQNA